MFKTHRHAVYHCLKRVQKPFRHASVFKTRVSTRACPFLKTRVFAHLSLTIQKGSRRRAFAEIRKEFLRTNSWVNFAGDFWWIFFRPFSLEKQKEKKINPKNPQQEMRLNSLNRDMFKPFCSHSGLLGRVKRCVLEDLHRFQRGFLQRDASMRALWSDRPNCSHNVSQKVKRIRRVSE